MQLFKITGLEDKIVKEMMTVSSRLDFLREVLGKVSRRDCWKNQQHIDLDVDKAQGSTSGLK